MKLPDIQFHHDIRLLIYRPRGLIDQGAINEITSVIEDLEAATQEPFNRFSDTLEVHEVELNFRYVIDVSLHRRLSHAGRAPVKSAILATDSTLVHYARLLASLTEGSSIKVRVFQERKAAAQWLGVPIERLTATDQVRVNVQLLNAQTDSHLWAETYDRKLTDIFSVESEIAKGIAESLQAKLTGREEQALAVKPTNNLEAYDAYLRGLAFDTRSSYSIDALPKAISFFEHAVQLDPNFAFAWARLSRGHAALYFVPVGDITAARRDAAKKALENAQKLQPNSPETQLALGYYQYHVLRDYELAKTTFGLVNKILPGSSEVPAALALVARREGHWDESVVYSEQALALDPRNVQLLNEAAVTYATLRQFPTVLKLYDRALDIVPDDPGVIAAKTAIHQAEGNLEQAGKLLSQINAQTPSTIALVIKMTQLRLERNYVEAIQFLQARLAQFHSASDIDKAITQVILAVTQRLAGDTAGARVAAEQACNTLEHLCKNQPDSAAFAVLLSLANSALGEKNSALKEAERAIKLLPSVKDRIKGPCSEENLALIQTMFGENSQAISTLTRLLQTPYSSSFYGQTPVTPALLRLDPYWDPLRADPAFQKLISEAEP